MSDIISAAEACGLSNKNIDMGVEDSIHEINKLIHQACDSGLFEVTVRSYKLESINQDIVDKLTSVGYKVTLNDYNLIINWKPDIEYHPTQDARLLVYLDYNGHDDIRMYYCPICGKRYTDYYLNKKYTDIFKCEECGQALYPLKGKE